MPVVGYWYVFKCGQMWFTSYRSDQMCSNVVDWCRIWSLSRIGRGEGQMCSIMVKWGSNVVNMWSEVFKCGQKWLLVVNCCRMCQMWSNVVACCQMLSKCGRMSSSMVRSGSVVLKCGQMGSTMVNMWSEVFKYGQKGLNVVKCGRMWSDVFKFGQKWIKCSQMWSNVVKCCRNVVRFLEICS
jgi:hypothetical protein